MNFADEHYVRIYTKDTKTWLRWGWEGQAVFMFVDRKLDKAGIMEDVDSESAAEDIALLTGLPIEVVEVGLPRLLRSGTFELTGRNLICPNYIEANTAKKSDALRAKEYRERRRDEARHTPSHAVTPRHASERNSEKSDDASQEVTEPSRDVFESDDSSHAVTCASPKSSSRAVQERNRGGAPPPLFPIPPETETDVIEVFEEWRSRFGAKGSKLLSRDARARVIREAIDGYGKATCLRVLAHAKNDGMVSGRDDERRVKHESIGYILGNQSAFERILKAADEASERESRSVGDVIDELSAREVAP